MMAFNVLLLHSLFFFFFSFPRFSSHAITINVYKILGDVDDDGNNTTTTNLLALDKLLFFSSPLFFHWLYVMQITFRSLLLQLTSSNIFIMSKKKGEKMFESILR